MQEADGSHDGFPQRVVRRFRDQDEVANLRQVKGRTGGGATALGQMCLQHSRIKVRGGMADTLFVQPASERRSHGVKADDTNRKIRH